MQGQDGRARVLLGRDGGVAEGGTGAVHGEAAHGAREARYLREKIHPGTSHHDEGLDCGAEEEILPDHQGREVRWQDHHW